jgi:hypothetical protein
MTHRGLFGVQEPERAARTGPGSRGATGEEPLQEHRVDCLRSRTQEVPEPRSVLESYFKICN